MGSIYGHESDENGEWLYRTINAYQLAWEDLTKSAGWILGTVYLFLKVHRENW